jgi:hypothetical protein
MCREGVFDMTPKIIKVNCDKWKDRLEVLLKILGVIVWGLLTFGLLYGTYFYFNWWSHNTVNWALYPFFIMIAVAALGSNTVNLYFLSMTIYDKQQMFKFKCVSGSLK